MDQAETGAMSPAFPHTADWIGVVGGVFPFFFSWRESSASPDWVAVAGGFVALVAGAFTTALLHRTPPEARTARVSITTLLIVLGVFQLAFRGFGLL